MTARRAFLSNFWVGTKGGLLTAKHIRKMGMARWLFDYLTRGQTSVNQHGVGVFQYGHPITLEQIALDMSEGEDRMPVRTIERWMARLKHTGYITTEAHSNHGLTIWIANAKDKTKKPRTVAEKSAQSAVKVTGKVTGKLPATNGGKSIKLPATNGVEFQNSPPHFVKDSPQAAEKPIDAAAIPKGFTSESPSYYNKPAAAKTAADDFSLPDSEKIQRLENLLTGEEREGLRALRHEAGRRLWKGKEEREAAYAALRAEVESRKQAAIR